MAKSHTTLSVEPELIEQAKQKGINISQLLEDSIKTEIMLKEGNEDELKLKLEEKIKAKERLKLEFNEKNKLIDLDIDLIKTNLERINKESLLFNKEFFEGVKDKFRLTCVRKNFILTPLNVKTWRAIFFNEARAKLTDNELLKMITEFKTEIDELRNKIPVGGESLIDC